MIKQLGTDDSVNACDCCGKTGLKFTFAVELESGEIAHYGSTCVVRHTGKTPAKIANELEVAKTAELHRRNAIFWGTAEHLALDARRDEAHALRLCGRPFKEFCSAQQAIADAKRAEIFA